MTWTFADLKNNLRAMFGASENSSQTVEGLVGRAVSRWYEYTWPHRGTLATASALSNYRASYQFYQTISLSASQPIAERTIFEAMQACKVKQIVFIPNISSTVTATATMAWHLIVLKRKSGATGSATTSYSQTFFVGGLSSDSTKHGTSSQSFSALTANVMTSWIGKPNKLCLANGAFTVNRSLDAKDILTAKVRKGSGTATDSGAIFPGGRVLFEIEEM